MNAAALSAWDSDFFDLRVARVAGDRLTPESAVEVDRWCADQHIDLCVLLAAADDPTTAQLAVRHGYVMIDLRMTLDMGLDAALPEPRRAVRLYRPDDLPALTRIAAESFTDSRLLYDPYFPKTRISEMYAVWLRQRCGDPDAPGTFPPADAVIVADGLDGQPAGFLICILRDGASGDPVGSVDLVAVDRRARGQYTGESMLRAGLRWFAERGCKRVEVVTQGRNVGAQRVYQRSGFALLHAQAWYHKWMTHA